ncbi:MAG TPA: lysophospholipid acyltransferase family protein [Burkholderiales bacterium]|nr:lysophospholipid acyltransferase family protein [Burkholderiales bacterium]
MPRDAASTSPDAIGWWFAVFAAILYGVYAALLLGLVAAAAWLVAGVTSNRAWARKIVRAAARVYLRLAGIGVSVRGIEYLPPWPVVLVANLASRLDALVLAAALPARYCFVATREFQQHVVAGVLLARIGVQFVEHAGDVHTPDDAERLVRLAANGTSLVFFPEGTPIRTAGLREFDSGAFIVATRADVPVVPVAIKGTRAILRAGQWLPRRGGNIVVTVNPPVFAATSCDPAAAAAKVRDSVRGVILRHCGEADLPQALAEADALAARGSV